MNELTLHLAGNFIVLVVLQVAAFALLPRTQGFTNPGVTATMLVLFAISYWLMARMIRSGADLGILIPLMAAVVPLAVVAIGAIYYHESASQLKIALLASACTLIGVASRY